MKKYLKYLICAILVIFFCIICIINAWWLGCILLTFCSGTLGLIIQKIHYSSKLTALQLQINVLQKQLEVLKKEQADAQMHAKNQIKDFYNKIAHTFRIPISIIQGYSDLLTSNIATSENLKPKYLLKISEHAAYLNSALSEIISTSHILDELPTIFAHAFDLILMLKELIKDVHLAAKQHKIELRLITSASNISFFGDKNNLRLVLFNVIENSIKYMQRAGAVNIIITDEAKNIKITIKDDGIGMSSTEVCKIFDKNYQGTNSVGGTGAGLYFTKLVILAHKGKISAQSNWGLGMSICISLPKARH